MTALAGFWTWGAAAEPARRCRSMLSAQQVYAPGKIAVAAEGEAALGRAHRPILPEDRFDKGPVSGGDGRMLLVADVRLDNREELWPLLGLSPAEGARLSDPQLLMRAIEAWDVVAVDRIVGDYTFAHWDGARRRLLLARDPAGERPLHYHRGRGFFAFASMPRGLHALAEVPRAIDREGVADFLAGVPETGIGTFHEGIEKVLPGHLATLTREGFWSFAFSDPPARELRLADPREYEEGLREQLDRAVASRLRGAEAGVAACFSGGLDSAAVAGTAARILRPSGGKVFAYAAAPLAPAWTELHPNLEPVPVGAAGERLVDTLAKQTGLCERPLLYPCSAPWRQAMLGEAQRGGLAALLTGHLGRCSFSFDGMPLLAQLMGQGRLVRLSRLAAQLVRSGSRPGRVAMAALGPYLPLFLHSDVRRWRRLERHTALAASAAAELRVKERAVERGFDPQYRPRGDARGLRLWALRRHDRGNLQKGLAGGWGIDLRDPLTDRRLVEFCLSAPLEEYVRGGVASSLARRAIADRVPPGVAAERPARAANGVRTLGAARLALKEEVARLAEVPAAAEMLDLGRMRRLADGWPDGGSPLLLRGLAAGLFIRQASEASR